MIVKGILIEGKDGQEYLLGSDPDPEEKRRILLSNVETGTSGLR